MRPVVSAVIATHNRAELLREALDSVYGQQGRCDLFDLEVIVVDDASSDHTRDVVARYPATYIRHETNQGVAVALNAAMRASRGTYIGFLGDDDLWLPSRLQVQVPVLEANPDVAVVYSSHLRSGVEEIWSDRSGQIFEELLEGNFISTITVLVRRTALLQVGDFEPSVAGTEDYDLWLRLAYHFPFRYVPGPLAVYRPVLDGLFKTTIATGASRDIHRRILKRALTLIPDASPETVQRVTDSMEYNNAKNLATLPSHLALSQMLEHLHEYPRIARNQEIRAWIVWKAREESVRATDPLQAARVVCTRIESALGDSADTRQLIGAVWTELAVGLLRARRANQAVRAAREAMRYDTVGFVGRGFAPLVRGKVKAASVTR